MTGLAELWYRQTTTARLALAPLWPLSVLMRAVVAYRTKRFLANPDRSEPQSQQIHCPVVVIGNLIVGGAGKTPTLIALTQQLIALGERPGIISRGYRAKGRADGQPMLVDAQTPAELAGDEPALLARQTGVPVVICQDRVAAARHLLNQFAQTTLILSDDGLQHHRLPRSLEIVVFDQRGVGNGRLIPTGPLREPLSRLASVDALVFNGGDVSRANLSQHGHADLIRALPSWSLTLQPLQFRRIGHDETLLPHAFVAQFQHKRIVAMAGIGHPARFFASLRALGLTITEQALGDHHHYRRNDLVRADADLIVMTAKDAIKCEGLGDQAEAWALDVKPCLTPLAPLPAPAARQSAVEARSPAANTDASFVQSAPDGEQHATRSLAAWILEQLHGRSPD